MGGEHVCTGCGMFNGNPHEDSCSHVTRERLIAAGKLGVGGALLVEDEDCVLNWTPPGPSTAPPPALDPLREAHDQLKGALMQSPTLGGQREVAHLLAACAQAAALVSIATDLRAMREQPTQVLLHPDDDGYLDQLVKVLRELPDSMNAAIFHALDQGR